MKNNRLELILGEINSTDEVLNVGCTGYDYIEPDVWIHKLICEKAMRVVGIDISIRDSESTCTIIEANAETMDLNDKFDIIIAGELIEHLSNPGAFLERAREHLKENGRLIITTPNPWDWIRLARAIFGIDSTQIKDHICWYDKETLTNLSSRSGFSVNKVEFIPRIPYGGFRKASIGEKGFCFISRCLYILGLKRIASMNLFMVFSLKTKVEIN